ncbi:MAG: hypothetical protein U0838_01185 [Chloroflexota bacterium]
MTSTNPSDDTHRYALRVRGHLDARWAAWFEDQTVTYAGDGITVIDARARPGRAPRAPPADPRRRAPRPHLGHQTDPDTD